MNHMAHSRRLLMMGALGVLAAPGRLAMAQPLDGPLSIIVPQPAGNSTDGMARKAAPILQKALGRPVIVENFPGAGGAIGVARVLAAAGDGNVMTIGSQTELILTPLSVAVAKYRPEDFRCIALTGITPYVLVTRPDFPASNLSDLAQYARQSGRGSITSGHIGPGTLAHLMSEQLGRKLGIQMTQVPYKGTPPVVQDLMGGQIDLTFLPLAGNTVSLIELGKIKAIATTATAIHASLPKVQPLGHQDAAMQDFVYTAWGAVFVPAKASPAAVQRLHKAFIDVLNDVDVRTWSAASGVRLEQPRSLAELDQFYRAEIRQYQALAKEIGVTPQ